jgi:hypothetical protein
MMTDNQGVAATPPLCGPAGGAAKASPAKPAAANAEIARLRDALIRCGRMAGAILSDDVSTEFLMLVPAEVEARIKRLELMRFDAMAMEDNMP